MSYLSTPLCDVQCGEPPSLSRQRDRGVAPTCGARGVWGVEIVRKRGPADGMTGAVQHRYVGIGDELPVHPGSPPGRWCDRGAWVGP